MATNLLEILKNALPSEIITMLSGVTGETTGNVRSAVNYALPAILAGLMTKTSTDAGSSEVLKLIKDDGYDGSMLNNLSGSLSDENKFYSIINRATNSVNSIFGEKLKEVTNFISKESGVSSNTSSSLLGFLTAIAMSIVGKQVLGKNLNSNSLTGLLSDQRDFIAGLIPPHFTGVLGIASLKKISSNVSDYKAKAEEEKSSGFKKILPWLLLVLALIVLFFIWRSCSKEAPVTKKVDSVKTEPKKIVQTYIPAPKTGDPQMDSIMAAQKFISKKLPSDTVIIIAENGVEAQLLKFIEDKNISPPESWISFDRVLFDVNKFSTLRPSSEYQTNNVVAILKAFPNVNLKIGGYTDNTGDSLANMKLSQLRADAVMNALIKKGIAPERLKAEGYGPQFPVATNETPEGRQKNRRVDVRISKK